ncbi:MAG: T9SS type A sorting domain-containing protein [Flavobacteriaceae bacterium]|jgi:hypothetical protein|nr:T9SS type A sorting domain-containing protein [Flavobacteriaceae bacterium]
MKKLSFLLAGLAFTVGFGQVNYLQTANTVISYPAPVSSDAICNFGYPSDAYYAGGELVSFASVIEFTEGETFQPSEMNIALGIYDDLSYDMTSAEIEITILNDDSSMFPSTEAISSVTVSPSEATFLETISLTSGAVIHMYQVKLDLSGMDAVTPEPGETMKWIKIHKANDDGVAMAVNFTLSAIGGLTYYWDDLIEDWNVFNASEPDNISFTYDLIGDCSVMGISEIDSSSVAVYPNPVKDILNVSAKNADVKEVQIVNMNGQVVASSKAASVNVSTLPSGVYIVKVVDAKGNVTTSKIVKK